MNKTLWIAVRYDTKDKGCVNIWHFDSYEEMDACLTRLFPELVGEVYDLDYYSSGCYRFGDGTSIKVTRLTRH